MKVLKTTQINGIISLFAEMFYLQLAITVFTDNNVLIVLLHSLSHHEFMILSLTNINIDTTFLVSSVISYNLL